MTGKDVATWITIGAMLIGAGIWLGKLQQQVTDMQQIDQYLHGDVRVPGGMK